MAIKTSITVAHGDGIGLIAIDLMLWSKVVLKAPITTAHKAGFNVVKYGSLYNPDSQADYSGVQGQ